MSSVLATLIRAREILEKGWTQWDLAVDSDGDWCAPRGDSAVCWCSVGALLRAAGDWSLADPAIAAVESHIFDGCLEAWNDVPGRTKEEVLALFDKTIAEQESSAAPSSSKALKD